MGVGAIFSSGEGQPFSRRGATVGFFSEIAKKIFQVEGPKVVKFHLSLSKLTKRNLFSKNVIGKCRISKCRGGKLPLPPSDVHAGVLACDKQNKTTRRLSWNERTDAVQHGHAIIEIDTELLKKFSML